MSLRAIPFELAIKFTAQIEPDSLVQHDFGCVTVVEGKHPALGTVTIGTTIEEHAWIQAEATA
jgi:hypothetical protein